MLVGEVWLCSGQSNMEMAVGGVLNKDAEDRRGRLSARSACSPCDRKTAEEPQDDCKGQWQVCSPEDGRAASRPPAYFFGRELHKQLGVPVGLINSSWGGTPIQSVDQRQGPRGDAGTGARWSRTCSKAIAAYDPEAGQGAYEKQLAEWEKAGRAAKARRKRALIAAGRVAARPALAPGSPGRLYNGMIAPLGPYAIRGAIWYQGESNAGAAALRPAAADA